ncbi:MAG TPA: hypothetical protein VK961_01780 [Chthoniobacter sp.]|nr:hypothetical protein [Chthoniobacter sp.]
MAVATAGGMDSVVPVERDPSRYTALKQRCPFALNSATPAPVAQASFAANWYVSGLARIGDAEFVSIKARDLSAQFSLYGREPDPKTHVALVRVEWLEGIGKSVVVIQKDGETARLEFNEATVRGPGQPAAMNLAAGANAPAAAASATPLPAGTRLIPVGAANGGPPQRYLRTLLPPANPATPAPNGATAGGHPPSQGANGVPRPMAPGGRRKALPQNPPGR